MSRHHFDIHRNGRRLRVVAGYDRPLDEFFLQILVAPEPDARAEEFVYASLGETSGDWTDPRTLTARLADLHIDAPASFLPAILDDRRQQVGNRLAFHYFDRAPEIEDF